MSDLSFRCRIVHNSSHFKVNLHLEDPLFVIFAYLLIYIFIYFGDSAIFLWSPPSIHTPKHNLKFVLNLDVQNFPVILGFFFFFAFVWIRNMIFFCKLSICL